MPPTRPAVLPCLSSLAVVAVLVVLVVVVMVIISVVMVVFVFHCRYTVTRSGSFAHMYVPTAASTFWDRPPGRLDQEHPPQTRAYVFQCVDGSFLPARHEGESAITPPLPMRTFLSKRRSQCGGG